MESIEQQLAHNAKANIPQSHNVMMRNGGSH